MKTFYLMCDAIMQNTLDEIELFDEERRMNNEYPGFDDFLKKLGGYDAIDNLSPIEKMQIAFLGGRVYESERDAEALRKLNVAALRKQA